MIECNRKRATLPWLWSKMLYMSVIGSWEWVVFMNFMCQLLAIIFHVVIHGIDSRRNDDELMKNRLISFIFEATSTEWTVIIFAKACRSLVRVRIQSLSALNCFFNAFSLYLALVRPNTIQPNYVSMRRNGPLCYIQMSPMIIKTSSVRVIV